MSRFLYEGKTVHYEVDGEGSPLLILNGIMMSTKSWQPFIPTLSERFQVVRVDFFDQGESEKLPGESYTQELQVGLLRALLDELKIAKIDIVGISYGGAVALLFSIMHPDRIRRLILFNSNAYTNPWIKDIGRGWIKSGKTRDGLHYYQTTIPVIYSPHFYEGRIEWMKNREKLLIPIFSDPGFLDQMERLTLSAETFDVRDKLSSVGAKTLIISAEEDYLTPIPNQEYLYERLPNAEWLKIPLAGHASMYEKPLLFTTIITGFFGVKDTEYKI